MNEQQLIDRCLKGDRRAQKAFYDSYAPKMMGVCLRYSDDKEEARDLLQEGFIKAFTSLNSYSGRGSLEGWLRRIFVNVALESLRKRKDLFMESVDLATISTEGKEEEVVSRLAAEELIRLIQSLPDGFRAVFNLIAIEGYSHKEVAEQLKIKESSSRSQYVRAREFLKEKIKSHD